MGLAESIVNFLLDNNHKIVILGKDRVEDKFGDLKDVYDYRNKLPLSEIAWIIKHAELFIGRDSGLMHVAAAVNCQIVAFNFLSDKWFPKMPEERYTALTSKESNFESISKAIKERT